MATLPGSATQFSIEHLTQLLHARINLAVAMPNLIDYIVELSFSADAPAPVRYRSIVEPGRPSSFPVSLEDSAGKLDEIVQRQIEDYKINPDDGYRCEIRNLNSFAWVPTRYSKDFIVYISLEGRDGRETHNDVEVFRRAFEGSVSANAEHISPLSRVLRQVSTGELVSKADLAIVERMPEFVRQRAEELPNGSQVIARGI